jgi:cobalt-zinc-cadmium efflux system protein
LSLGAFLLSKRPPSRRRTFGYYRLEVLAAFANGVILIVLSILVIFQSWQRFKAPVEIRSLEALGIAIVGLAFNLLTARELLKADHSHINIRGAFIHVLSDTLGSIGAIIAMALTYLFNWTEADAIVSASIGLMILFTAWRLISETTNVMLEGAPEHLDSDELRRAIQNLPGIDEVHDLHLWCLSSNQVSFSAHVVSKTATENCLHQEILVQVQNLLKNNFGIQHSTIQIESENMRDKESTHP